MLVSMVKGLFRVNVMSVYHMPLPGATSNNFESLACQVHL